MLKFSIALGFFNCSPINQISVLILPICISLFLEKKVGKKLNHISLHARTTTWKVMWD